MKRIGIDTGGTFTDIVYINEDTMEIIMDKARSTPKDPGQAVLQAIEKTKVDMAQIALLVHGTTVAVNTLIQRKGAKVGLITTKGFQDILEIGRGDRRETYNFLWKKPEPLVPRNLRFEVGERTTYKGEILEKLDPKEAEEATKKLREKGVEAIAVCFLHSYANPENEQKMGEIINKIWPEVTVSLSSEIVREFREYERTSTAVLDAYIKKSVTGYLSRLAENLARLKFTGQLLVTSPGGVVGVASVEENALTTITSGPMGGAAGAAYLGKLIGAKNLLTIDVGGTSFDLSVIKDGTSLERYESELIGFPVLVRGVDVRSIGAGGGSIARVDPGGLLHVGPESAGADPGPMCYGLGGVEPTVTDAALVNGLIDPNYFLGGEILLDANLAKKGVSDVAKALGTGLNEAAEGILAVAKNNMTGTVREILVGQGLDPRDFTMLAYGGAGGIFAGDIAEDMGIRTIIVPFAPGVFSAWGILTMDIVHNYVETYMRPTDELDFEKLGSIYQKMENDTLETLKQENIPRDTTEYARSIDMCYEGQGHFVNVPVPGGRLSKNTKAEVIENFHCLHNIGYGYRTDRPTITSNVRIKAIGRIKEVPLKEIKQGKEIPSDALKPKRKAYLNGRFVECQIYERDKLLSGNTINGPAVIEERLHTTIIGQDQTANVDKFGNLIINMGGA